MSDWEDEPTVPQIATKRVVKQQYADEWDDGPSSYTAPQNDRYERNHRDSYRGTEQRNDRYDRNRHDSYRGSDRGSDRDKRQLNGSFMDTTESSQEDKLSFTVNKSSVGGIIGRGGSKIKEIELTFGVKLNIGELNFVTIL